MYPFGQKSFPLINYIDNSCVMHNKCIFLITLDSMFAQVHLSKHISRINKIIITEGLRKSNSKAERANLPFLYILVPLKLSTNWMMTTHNLESNTLHSVY